MRLSIKKNDKKARTWIFLVSIIIFSAIVILGRVKLDVDLGFNEHVFATINAVINTVVSILLLCGLITARQGNYTTHKNIMLLSIALSVLFLVFYICHHLFAGETKYGGEGSIRYIYYFILGTHIILAAIILPFILFTAYRALINENEKHRKLAKITWPVWFYVALTGPVVYLMISPYY
jgi:putative membrane protein